MSRDCPKGKILNEATGKCVLKDGRIGKSILKGTYTPKSESLFEEKKCRKSEILNPITNKCVSKDGAVGRKITSGKMKLIKYDDCPPGKISYKNKSKTSCISVYGKLAQSLIKSKKLKLPKGKEISSKKDKDCIKRSGLSLKDYQIKVIKFMLKHRGLLVVHKVGTGKTLTAIATSQCVMDKYPKMETVVITPKSLQNHFKRIFKKK
jgi:hypothetical protein